MKYLSIWVAVTAAFILVTGCEDQISDAGLPQTLRIGVLPDENPEKLVKRYEPLRKHLSESLGIPSELAIFESYDALVEAFGKEKVDLVNFGGLTFVKAENTHDAAPLVMRDVDMRFTSYFIVRAENPAKTIEDCKQETFAFGSRLSTSGHLMPRHFLSFQNIEPETFFKSLHYSGAHDKTMEWVRDGVVTVGVLNARIFREMLNDGRIGKNEVRVLWETPPYCDYVWAVQSSLDRTARLKLLDAFLALSPAREEHDIILRSLDAGGFFPAEAKAFSDLKEIALGMGLIR